MNHSEISKGLSLQYVSDLSLLNLKEIPSFYNSIELKGDPADNLHKSYPGKQLQFSLCDCLSASLTRSIADQPPTFIKAFKKQFESICTQAATNNIHSLTLDFSLDTAFQNETEKQKRIQLLKSISPALILENIHLLLPIRIPLIHQDIGAYYLDLITQVMNPNIHFVLEVHPHELGLQFEPAKFLKWLKFDINVIKFIYELDLGNHLVDKLLYPWLNYLQTIRYQGTVTFAPHTQTFEDLTKEAKSIKTMLQQIETEENS